MAHSFLRAWLAAVLLALTSVPTLAVPQERTEQAFAEAKQASRSGPADIELAAQAVLHLPANHIFVPQPQAGKLLNAMGNPGQDPHLHGLVFPADGGSWFMTIRYEASGFVKDDDARDWNADELLKSYQEGTAAANEERQKMGAPAIEVLGWAERPAYDASSHRLAWAMSSRAKDAPADAAQGVNYNTYALGREGYFSLNLVTDLPDLPAHRPAAQALLAALEYKDGKRYADFESGDPIAEYGLAALVVGVAAKKLGFIALALAFFAKFAKVILLGLAVVGGVAARVFKRKKAAGPTA